MRTKNHFKSKCRSTTPRVNTVEEVIEEFFRIINVWCGSRAMITMEVGKPSSQSQVTFQVDTGAECNLLALIEGLPTSQWGREFETGQSLDTPVYQSLFK